MSTRILPITRSRVGGPFRRRQTAPREEVDWHHRGVTAEDTRAAHPATPIVFRPVPLVSLVAVGFVALGTSTIAFQAHWWFAFFLIPLAMAWWVVRTRTVVDAEGLHVRTAVGSRSLPWSSVATLRVVEHSRICAVRSVAGAEASGPEASGPEFSLPGVRVRDLARVGVASGGRLRVPSPAEAEAAAERERELAAARLRIERLRAQQAPVPAGSDPDDPDDADPQEADPQETDPEQDGEQGRPGA